MPVFQDAPAHSSRPDSFRGRKTRRLLDENPRVEKNGLRHESGLFRETGLVYQFGSQWELRWAFRNGSGLGIRGGSKTREQRSTSLDIRHKTETHDRRTAMIPSELEKWRSLFPITKRYAWFNHAGVAPTSTRVIERMRAHLEDYLQHSVVHGDAWEERTSEVRGLCARLIGADADEVAFVRNTSHGLSLVGAGIDWREGDGILCALDDEYPSNIYPWQRLSERKGVRVQAIRSHNEAITPEAIVEAADERTRMLVISSIQYASGYRVDLEELGALCASRGWYFCVDAIQSLGAFPIDVKRCKIHFLAADSHKWMLGLPGIGLFYAEKTLIPSLEPALIGWKSTIDGWEFDRADLRLLPTAGRFEEGTPAYALIDGLGAAVELLLEIGIDPINRRIIEIRERLREGLLDLPVTILGSWPPAHRSGALTFRPRSGTSDELVEFLSRRGVVASCRRNRVRLSPHFYTSEDEVARVLEVTRAFCAQHG